MEMKVKGKFVLVHKILKSVNTEYLQKIQGKKNVYYAETACIFPWTFWSTFLYNLKVFNSMCVHIHIKLRLWGSGLWCSDLGWCLPVSHRRGLVWVPAALLPNQFPANVPREATGVSLSPSGPAIHVGNQGGAPGSCLHPGPDLATWGTNQQSENLFVCHSTFQVHK